MGHVLVEVGHCQMRQYQGQRRRYHCGGWQAEHRGWTEEHELVTFGTVVWCEVCDCFAESRTSRQMQKGCPEPPPAAAGNGGMRQQLMALRAGFHIVTRRRLSDAVGGTAQGRGAYSRLTPSSETVEDFRPYVPVVFGPPVPSGDSAGRTRWLLRQRVRCKMCSEAARLRRNRCNIANAEVQEVIRTCINAAGNMEHDNDQGSYELIRDGGEPLEQPHAEGDSDEKLWRSLPTGSIRYGHILCIPTPSDRSFPGKAKRSRLDAL